MLHDRLFRSPRQVYRFSLQQGSALIIALVFLLAMTLIGVAAMQGTTQQETMAGNMRQKNLAFQAAEAALRVAERQLVAGTLPAFSANSAVCLFNPPLVPSTDIGTFWMNYNWSSCQTTTGLTQVGSQPRFAAEDLGTVALQTEGNSVKIGQALMEVQMYRVTSRGSGGTDDAVAILQSLYQRLN